MGDQRVALIRGINVGRAKRVAMGDLRALLERLGYTGVRTLLNSGNIVFEVVDSNRGSIAERIERAMTEQLGVSAGVVVLTPAEMALLVSQNPLLKVADNPSRLLAAVPKNPEALSRLQPLMKQDWTPEVLAIGERAAYLWCPDSILASRLIPAVGQLLGDAVTTRNWSTIMKCYALVRKEHREESDER